MVKTKKTKKKKSNEPIIFTVSKIFFAIAILCFIVFSNLLLVRMFPVPKKNVLADTIVNKKMPIEVSIKDVNIDLPIYPAGFKNNTFDTTTQGASYLTSSPLPGQIGNSIVYAHNWWNLFGNLYNVKKGEKIDIVYPNNIHKSFTIVSTQTVPAKQVSILNKTTDKRITLFTCTDFLDADRFVVTAMATN